ncbi:MAG TPA: winged helix-turn-helix domain-containing protein [Ktedonobacteraceae bacterium]
MDEQSDRLAALEQRIDYLQAQLTALEQRMPPTPSANADRASPLPSDLTTLLSASRSIPTQDSMLQGEVLYAGVLDSNHRHLQFQQRQQLLAVFEAAPEPLAQLFAALSSSHRIIILRLLCQKPHSSQSLQELLRMSSPGQLYHHLKELLAAGLIVQRGRRDYDIAPGQQVPICLALAVASHLMTEKQGEEGALPVQEDQGPKEFDSD